MKASKRILAVLAIPGAALAAYVLVPSNIDPANKYSWSENAGWMNWRDANGAADGVFVAADHLSGHIWMENAGWLNVGDGSAPYANTDDTNFGVNILGGGDLDGMAWGENIGWVNFGWAAGSANADRARFDTGASRFRGYAWGENLGWINLDDATHFVTIELGVPAILEVCPNDFELANNGAGGERLSRFGCISAPAPGDPPAAIRVVLRTMHNTSGADPDGASVCFAGRTAPGLSQFEGETRWLGPPAEFVDDSIPPEANYIASPLVCTSGEANVRDWTAAGLQATFGGDADVSRIHFIGTAVTPCSVYEVSACADPNDLGTCSAPVLFLTSLMGDMWPPFNLPGQPNYADINAAVDKFKTIGFVPGAVPSGGPYERHALIRDNLVAKLDEDPVKKVNFIDIGLTVDAFKGLPYNADGPCDPDTGIDTCGNPCSTLP